MKRTHIICNNMITTIITLVVATGLFSSCQSTETEKKSPDKAMEKETSIDVSENKVAQKKLVAYYFFTTYRCRSCNMIENLTKQAILSGFEDQISKGLLEFKTVNIDLPENEHYIKDYKLYTKSVIVSTQVNGKESGWKNLDQVWTLLRDENKFIEYIQKEVKALL